MKIKYYIVFFVIAFISCKAIYHSTPDYIRIGFKFKYDSAKTGLDSIININGYYTELNLFEHSSNVYDTVINNMIFFPDGVMVTGFLDTKLERIEKQKGGDINTYLKETETNGFYEWFGWGSYIICNDTIKIQYIKRPILGSTNAFWYAYEVWYKIINRNSIICIYIKPLHKMSNSDWENFKINEEKTEYFAAKFIPTDFMPKSDGWIKEESWFWCSEEDYKEFMKKQKKK